LLASPDERFLNIAASAALRRQVLAAGELCRWYCDVAPSALIALKVGKTVSLLTKGETVFNVVQVLPAGWPSQPAGALANLL
jgi:hypothetical protein